MATKLALGYTLDQISNDITRSTPASFEPALDYVVVKIPRFHFSKFPHSDTLLSTQMQSVGEVMSIGRSFAEALQKAFQSLEDGWIGWEVPAEVRKQQDLLRSHLINPHPTRLLWLKLAFQMGMDREEIGQLTNISQWFLYEMEQLVSLEGHLRAFRLEDIPLKLLRKAKRMGFSDDQLAQFFHADAKDIRSHRIGLGVVTHVSRVDSCAGEFPAHTNYMYCHYEQGHEPTIKDERKTILVLGAGPNRIGQGIEFDNCCVHAVQQLKAEGFRTIMVNCNPETVSTDYDLADVLYFEPITLERVLDILELENCKQVVVQFGGQTPLKLAKELEEHGYDLFGTSFDSIDWAEDRDRFAALCTKVGIPFPEFGMASNLSQANEIAHKLGYPLMVRPSFVLGGQSMAIVHSETQLDKFLHKAMQTSPEGSVILDVFLEDAAEFDVDAWVHPEQGACAFGIMDHIEEAGIHSGDSRTVFPSMLNEKETGRN